MQLIEPSFHILIDSTAEILLQAIECAARTCYKSEDKITEDSAEHFVENIIKRGHEAMIEFADITVRFIHNRGFTHEIVRHRMCSFAQESTRYCNYSKDKFGNEITFINPYWLTGSEGSVVLNDYIKTLIAVEEMYMKMIAAGLPPNAARGILPNDLKTEIVVKANIREWRHIFELRTADAAHPDMKRIMIPLLWEFKKRWPTFFLNIGPAAPI